MIYTIQLADGKFAVKEEDDAFNLEITHGTFDLEEDANEYLKKFLERGHE